VHAGSFGFPLLKAEGDKVTIDSQRIPHQEVVKGFNTLPTRPPNVLQEMVKNIEFGS
jgi:hypothetical protein